ncbi:MAG: M23 family metallopeptidase [Cyanobacteria bacterium P01_D01_bin.105]
MIFTILLVLTTHLFLPVWLNLNLLIFDRPASQIELVLAILCCGSYSLFIFLLGNWSWVGYGWRYGCLGLFAITATKSALSIAALPLWTHPNPNQWLNLIVYGFLFVLFTAQSIEGLMAKSVLASPLSMTFPLEQGTYYISHGGSRKIANHHYPSEAQRFALDIVKLNRWGLRAAGLYPVNLEKYEIFGDNLYSPCDGEVVRAVDGLDDLIPPNADRENLAGNHVIVRCGDYLVAIAHMKQNSISVKVGDTVTSGQLLGKVGNSGNTSEPHLHIHAVKGSDLDDVLKGTGVPLSFNKRFLVRNDVIK